MADQTSYTDGLSAIATLTVSDLNNGFNYTSQGGSVDENAEAKIYYDDNMVHIGSDVRSTGFSGSLGCTYSSADYSLLTDDHRIRVGHVVQYRNAYFSVSAVKGGEVVRDTIKPQLTIQHLVCPVLNNLLSAEGQFDTDTKTVGSAYSKTITAVNTRAGATLAWSLDDEPSGMTIGASTGIIAWATPVAGSYTIKVRCKDSVSGKDDREGFSYLRLTVSP
jgi:hypothetical protein